LRHTTAIHLLKAGVDFAPISQWLGHEGLQTTMRYVRADLDLKRQALAQVFPDALGAPKAGGFALRGTELTRLASAPVIQRGCQLVRRHEVTRRRSPLDLTVSQIPVANG
jgi:hypothetical protein